LAVRQKIAVQFVDFSQENSIGLPSGDAALQYKNAGRAMLAPTTPYDKSQFAFFLSYRRYCQNARRKGHNRLLSAFQPAVDKKIFQI